MCFSGSGFQNSTPVRQRKLNLASGRKKSNWQILKGGIKRQCSWSLETNWFTLTIRVWRTVLHCAVWVWFSGLDYTGCFSSAFLPPPLQQQHKAMREWRQSDVLWFILPESLHMLSVPHEGSDESRLSVRHLIISQKSLWCYPLTMAHSSLLTTVPTNNEELTAATNGDGVVPTVHLRVRQIK